LQSLPGSAGSPLLRAGFAPAGTLPVGHGLHNIEAAHRLGVDVHLFDRPAALRPALKSRGLR